MSAVKKSSILLVDDDKDICKTLSLILENADYNVEVAHSGKEAIKKSKAKTYDITILDIMLPDMQGTELLKKIHKTRPSTIKVMLTGYPSLENAVKALNYDADAYLIKPVSPENLLKVIKEKFKKRKREEIMTTKKIAAFVERRVNELLQGAE